MEMITSIIAFHLQGTTGQVDGSKVFSSKEFPLHKICFAKTFHFNYPVVSRAKNVPFFLSVVISLTRRVSSKTLYVQYYKIR